MSKTLRTRKNGERVYEIRVSRGRDPITGKQLTPYTMVWHIPDNYSDKRAEREAAKIEGEFISKCKAGSVQTKQAEKALKKKIAEQEEAEKLLQLSKPTFELYVNYYLKQLSQNGRALGTINSYSTILHKIELKIGSFKMNEIEKSHIKFALNDIFTNSDFKHSTKICYFNVLKSFFDAAVEDGIIERSPMIDIKPPRKPKDENKNDQIKAYSEDEISYIMDCFNKEPLKWKTLMIFMLDSGCRRGEVAGLKWENINLDSGKVTISNNRQYTPGKGVYDTTPKNGKTRVIYLTETALIIMKEWHKQLMLSAFTKQKPRPGYCFPGNNGEGMNPYYISNYFKDFGKRYNIPNFHPHILRHTMATLSIANGADIVSISKKLGHFNPSITLNTYSHANEEAQKRANEALEKAIYNNETNKRQA